MKTRLLFCFIVGLLVSITHAYATSYTWTGSGANTNWNNNANWNPSTGHPVAGDQVTIPTTTNKPTVNVASACATISITGTTTLTLSANLTLSGTLTLGSGASLTIPAGTNQTLSIGGTTTLNSSASQFTINAGNNISFAAVTISSGCSLINYAAATSSNVTLNSSGSSLYNHSTGSFAITGTLVVSSGCTVTNDNSMSVSSTITLKSSGSSISNSSTGTFNANGDISIASNCNISNSGIFNANGSAVTMASSSAYISNTSTGTFTINNNASIAISSTCYINNAGTFYAGTHGSPCTINLNTNSNEYITNTGHFYVGSTSVINMTGNNVSLTNTSPGVFTLQSDALGSATIGALSSSAAITGTYNVERYLQGGTGYRSYRLLSSPVFTATVSSVNVYGINYLKNSMYLTGTTLAAGGFDVNTSPATTSENPTLYLYTETINNPQFTTFLNSNFAGISKINNAPTYNYSVNSSTYTSTYNIPVGSGFLCFYRGDRSTSFANKTTAPFPVPESTTLTTSGTINTGTLTARNWFNPGATTLSYTAGTNASYRGFNLVGNPYPSTIDWETYSNTAGSGIYVKSVTKTVYELNPQTQNFDTYQKGGAATNNGSRYIASGQGFFVLDTLASVGFLVFNESAKVDNQNTGSNLFMGTPDQQTANSQYLRLQLAMDTINRDDMMLRFSNGVSSRYNGDLDAPYKQGMGKVSLASLSGDHLALAINTRSLPKKADTIGLMVSATADGVYSLNMKQLVGIPQLFDVWLIDRYKKDSLDMRHNATYSFNVYLADTASFGLNRFALIIRQNPALAYHLLSFTAAKEASPSNSGKHVQLNWTTENEANYTYFTVERSNDNGNTYQVAGSVTASGLGKYGLVDQNPAAHNLYRLKSVDINGAITYSYILPITYTEVSGVVQNVNIYPNPVGSMLTVSIAANNGSADTYKITITNSSGLMVKQATSSQPNWQSSAGDLLPGTYVVKVYSNKTQTEVGNSKFVKL